VWNSIQIIAALLTTNQSSLSNFNVKDYTLEIRPVVWGDRLIRSHSYYFKHWWHNTWSKPKRVPMTSGGLGVTGPEARLKMQFSDDVIMLNQPRYHLLISTNSTNRDNTPFWRIRSWDYGMTDTTEKAKGYSLYTTLKSLRFEKTKLAKHKS